MAKPEYKKRLLRTAVFSITWCTWAALHFKILAGFHIPFWQALVDTIVSNTLLAASCLLISSNMRYYLPGKEKYWYVLVVSFTLSAICIALTRLLLWIIYQDDAAYMHILSLSSNIRFAIGFLLTGCITMLSLLWYTQRDREAMGAMKQEAEDLLKEAELFKLRQQLQPHFLFNSLNSISALAGTRPEEARHMIQQLSDFLRGTLRKEEKQLVTLQDEIQFLELYLNIEKVRFGNRLLTQLNISEEAALQMVPSLILQPIVENAIKFGLYDTTDEVMITIEAFITEQQLTIEVSNPFDPDTTPTGKGTGFGLASVQRRLFLLYTRNDLLQTTAAGNIFITRLTFPL